MANLRLEAYRSSVESHIIFLEGESKFILSMIKAKWYTKKHTHLRKLNVLWTLFFLGTLSSPTRVLISTEQGLYLCNSITTTVAIPRQRKILLLLFGFQISNSPVDRINSPLHADQNPSHFLAKCRSENTYLVPQKSWHKKKWPNNPKSNLRR